MKKLFLILAVSFSVFFLFMSCRSDNDTDAKPTIVGTWQPVTLTYSGTLNGQNVSQTIASNECQQKSRITFKSDNSGVIVGWSDDSGSCVKNPDVALTYSYDENTKALSLTADGETQTGTVTELNDKHLTYSMQTTYDFNGQNIPVTLEMKANRIN